MRTDAVMKEHLPNRSRTDRPLIGVTLSARRSFWIWSLHRLAIWRAGGRAVKITAHRRARLEHLDGLVVGGGDDISFQMVEGELNPSVRYDPERDRLERRLLEQAFERDIPVLGICRGAQMINLVRGGTLFNDIAEVSQTAPRARTLLRKKTIDLIESSSLARIMGCNPCHVNALHHQAVRDPGDGLCIVAKDRHGIVQAIEAPRDRFTVGVQWHPELLPFSKPNRNIFSELITAAC